MCPVYVNIEKLKLLSSRLRIDMPQQFCESPQNKTTARLSSTQAKDKLYSGIENSGGL